jgi:DNA-binding transcriptional MerR regulator
VTTYSNADVEKLLGVKGHIIRYWQKEFDLIQPVRDIHGRFRYSRRDIEIFLRVKHLVHERKFSVEGAREQLLKEAAGKKQNTAAEISQLRSELLNVYFVNRKRAVEAANKDEEGSPAESL